MSNAVLVTALGTTLSLMGLWLLFFGFYRDYRVDLFRQRMFGLRDELFALAAAGGIAFDDPAYGLMRTMINGYIRFAHRLSFLLVALALRSGSTLRVGAASMEKLTAAVKAKPPRTREELERILSQVHWYVADQLVLTSAIMWLLIIPLGLGALMRALSERVMSVVRKSSAWRVIKMYSIVPMDSTALAAGAG